MNMGDIKENKGISEPKAYERRMFMASQSVQSEGKIERAG